MDIWVYPMESGKGEEWPSDLLGINQKTGEADPKTSRDQNDILNDNQLKKPYCTGNGVEKPPLQRVQQDARQA